MSLGGVKKPKPNFWVNKKEVNRKRSQKQEKKLQKPLMARTNPNSGATPFASQKGDLSNDDFVFEAKLTNKGNITLNRNTVVKIYKEASKVGKWPGIVMTVEGLPSHVDKDWVCVPLDVFDEIFAAYHGGKEIAEDEGWEV